jgi:Ca2+/Na+ antiporter
MGIQPGVLAITLIAVGTSIPDAITCYRGAKISSFADASIGNLLGVNTASCLIGFGVPWVIGIVFYNHQASPNNIFKHPPAGILMVIAVYMITSALGIFILILNRVILGGELGAKKQIKFTFAFILVSLWAAFIIVCTLHEYKIILN